MFKRTSEKFDTLHLPRQYTRRFFLDVNTENHCLYRLVLLRGSRTIK